MKPKFCPISSGSGLEGRSVLSSLGSVGVVSVVVVIGGVVGMIGDPGVTEGRPAEGEIQRNIILKLSIGKYFLKNSKEMTNLTMHSSVIMYTMRHRNDTKANNYCIITTVRSVTIKHNYLQRWLFLKNIIQCIVYSCE